MASFECPFCHQIMSVGMETHSSYSLGFKGHNPPGFVVAEDSFKFSFDFYCCPSCLKVAVFATGIGDVVKNIHVPIYPPFHCKNFPEFIPEAIRNDYREACAIITLSPKASATLARRCLQGMIHDFWGIVEKNLNAEITSLKGKIPITQWNAIDALRKIGNIGAHMESNINLIVDVEVDEAQRLIKLIELLLDKWYIARHDEETLFAEISSISEQKTSERDLNTAAINGQ